MRNNDVKQLIMAWLNRNAASARLVASVNRFNAFACMFIQFFCTHGLISGYLLQSAALLQAYKSTQVGRAHWAILCTLCYPQSTHTLFVSQSQFPPPVIQDPTCVNKLYNAFEKQTDSCGDRVFSSAKSGLVFESLQLLDPTVAPILVIVASDASHKGHVSRHPSYCKYLQ